MDSGLEKYRQSHWVIISRKGDIVNSMKNVQYSGDILLSSVVSIDI